LELTQQTTGDKTMAIAIQTKILPPTRTKPTRIKVWIAKRPDAKRVYSKWQFGDLGYGALHRQALAAFLSEQGAAWGDVGDWHSGELQPGHEAHVRLFK
jgi:hypothetical protein